MEPKASESKIELFKAKSELSSWWRSHTAPKPTVRDDALKHLSALRKCLEQVETLDDRSAESGSSWQSPELESDIEAADKALRFLYELFGVPEVLP